MVADALEILRNHQQIQCNLTLAGFAGNRGYQCLLDIGKILIDQIVLFCNRASQINIAPDKRVYALRDHGTGLLCHAADKRAVECIMAEEKRDDFRDIRCLIANAFHIRDHFECCRNLPQITRDRLLLQKQLQTQGFNAPFLLVCLFLQFGDRCGG